VRNFGNFSAAPRAAFELFQPAPKAELGRSETASCKQAISQFDDHDRDKKQGTKMV